VEYRKDSPQTVARGSYRKYWLFAMDEHQMSRSRSVVHAVVELLGRSFAHYYLEEWGWMRSNMKSVSRIGTFPITAARGIVSDPDCDGIYLQSAARIDARKSLERAMRLRLSDAAVRWLARAAALHKRKCFGNHNTLRTLNKGRGATEQA